MKIPLSLDKREWRPSVLPGQIVLVSTFDADGAPNLAPKSWISMAAFTGPMIAFGCNVTHSTYQNLRRSGAFVVNIPDASLVERIWSLPGYHGPERVSKSGFTMQPAQVVDAPLVSECRAHLECIYDDDKRYGDEVMIFGRIAAMSVDAECLEGESPAQYFHLRPVFFLEDGTYGALDAAHRVGALPPTEMALFLIEVGEPPDRDQAAAQVLLDEHLAYLSALRQRNQLVMAGAFRGGDATGRGAGGMYVVSAASLGQAEDIARQDPMVAARAAYMVKAWQRSF